MLQLSRGTALFENTTYTNLPHSSEVFLSLETKTLYNCSVQVVDRAKEDLSIDL